MNKLQKEIFEMEQETVEQGFDRIYDSMDFTEFCLPSFKLGVKWRQEQDNTANEILDYILINDDGVGIALGYNSREMIENYFKQINYK